MHSNSALNLHGTVCNTNKMYLLLKGIYSEDTTSKHNMRHWCIIWRNEKSWSTSQWQGFCVTGRARELSWDRGQCQHSCRAPIRQKRGEGFGNSLGDWNQSLGRVCLPVDMGCECCCYWELARESEQVMCLQRREVNPAAAERVKKQQYTQWKMKEFWLKQMESQASQRTV